MMWAVSAVFALVGPLAVGALVRGYGVEAVGWWSGGSLGVAGGLIGGVVWVRGVGGKGKGEEEGERGKDPVRSPRSLGCVA